MKALVRLNAPLLAAAIVAAAPGCGGSSSGKPLTLAQLRAKANPICRRALDEVDWSKIVTKEFSPRRAAALGAIEERASDELSRLTPPSALLVQWVRVVDGFRAAGPSFRHMAQVLVIKGSEGYPKLPLAAEQTERMAEARALGIEECARY